MQERKCLNLGSKMPYLGIFLLKFGNKVVKLELILSNWPLLEPKTPHWDALGSRFEKYLSNLKSVTLNLSYSKVWKKRKQKQNSLNFETKTSDLDIFELEIETFAVVFAISVLDFVKLQYFLSEYLKSTPLNLSKNSFWLIEWILV